MNKKKTRVKNRIIKSESKKMKCSEGFTILEIILSLAILSLILGGVTLFSLRSLQSYTRSRAMQGALENTRFAIESLSKKLRTSHDVTFGSGNIFFIDNVSSDGYCYRQSSGRLQVGSQTGATTCAGIASFEDLIGDEKVEVNTSFSGDETDANSRGYVIIEVDLAYKQHGTDSTPSEQNSIKIRSAVSLKDYGF